METTHWGNIVTSGAITKDNKDEACFFLIDKTIQCKETMCKTSLGGKNTQSSTKSV